MNIIKHRSRFPYKTRLVLGAILMMSCCVFADTGIPESNSTTTRARWDNKEILPPTNWQECTLDNDCATVETTCSGCCDGYGSVNRKFVDAFRKRLNDGCSKGYSKGDTRIMCDCEPIPGRPRCKQHRCSFVPEHGYNGK